MEDEGTIKKSTIFWIVFLIAVGIVLVLYFLFREDSLLSVLPSNPVEEQPSDTENSINENGIYGMFMNKEDSNSYLEIKEDDTFKFVLNVCEGYVTYDDENAILSKNISMEDGVYNISLNIRPKSYLDVNNLNFTSKSISSDGIVYEYNGPSSCSPSSEYKRT